MSAMKTKGSLRAQRIINSNWFNFAILLLIVINGILIGVQTYDGVPEYVHYIQLFIISIFFLEVIIRWKGRTSTQDYISDWWNWFDIFILVVGIVPEVADILVQHQGGESQNSVWATLRVLRIIQLTRSIRAIEELRVLIGVLIRSIRSLSYIAVLFLLIMYIYAIIGVTLFKNHDYQNSEHLELTISNPDPYGDLFEAFFTLFRILTGEDWTDLRYNLLNNEHTQQVTTKTVFIDGKEVEVEVGGHTIPATSNTTVTIYHVSWMVVAAYLMMNLVVGAIVNNFQLVLDAQREEEEAKKNSKE
ncbi:MAG: ion transporter [Aureispira sp.]|nr:ion transporter [Aureispira sp.]